MSPDDVMEMARLKGRVIALEAQVQTLEAEAKVYEAMRRTFAKYDSQEVTRLKAEVERLTATMEKVISAADLIDERNQHLIAEVERLRKAGDAMVELLVQMDVVMDMDSDHPEVEAWNAAKEGKQS